MEVMTLGVLVSRMAITLSPFLSVRSVNLISGTAAEVAGAAAEAAYRRALTELARARGTLLRERAVDFRTTP
jgi:hypothetical protein